MHGQSWAISASRSICHGLGRRGIGFPGEGDERRMANGGENTSESDAAVGHVSLRPPVARGSDPSGKPQKRPAVRREAAPGCKVTGTNTGNALAAASRVCSAIAVRPLCL